MSRAHNNAEMRQHQQPTSTMSNHDNRWLRNRDGRGGGGQGLETRCTFYYHSLLNNYLDYVCRTNATRETATSTRPTTTSAQHVYVTPTRPNAKMTMAVNERPRSDEQGRRRNNRGSRGLRPGTCFFNKFLILT
jgi:hypothetical protein